MRHLTLEVDGMSCGHCIKAVHRALERVTGLIVRSVALGTVEIDLEVPGPAPDSVITALAEAGYPARVSTTP